MGAKRTLLRSDDLIETDLLTIGWLKYTQETILSQSGTFLITSSVWNVYRGSIVLTTYRKTTSCIAPAYDLFFTVSPLLCHFFLRENHLNRFVVDWTYHIVPVSYQEVVLRRPPFTGCALMTDKTLFFSCSALFSPKTASTYSSSALSFCSSASLSVSWEREQRSKAVL